VLPVDIDAVDQIGNRNLAASGDFFQALPEGFFKGDACPASRKHDGVFYD
jgi:hypothetical protein